MYKYAELSKTEQIILKINNYLCTNVLVLMRKFTIPVDENFVSKYVSKSNNYYFIVLVVFKTICT